MTGMKIDEEFVPDRRIEVETDDEENEAERDCNDTDDDETGSDECGQLPPSSHSHNCNNDPWPQTYRSFLVFMSYNYLCIQKLKTNETYMLV